MRFWVSSTLSFLIAKNNPRALFAPDSFTPNPSNVSLKTSLAKNSGSSELTGMLFMISSSMERSSWDSDAKILLTLTTKCCLLLSSLKYSELASSYYLPILSKNSLMKLSQLLFLWTKLEMDWDLINMSWESSSAQIFFLFSDSFSKSILVAFLPTSFSLQACLKASVS